MKKIVLCILISITMVATTSMVNVSEVSAASVGTVKGLEYLHDYKSVTLKWDAVKGAEGYHIYKNGKSKPIMTVKGTKARVKGLNERYRYNFSVAAFKDGKVGKRATLKNCAPIKPMFVTFKPKAKRPYYRNSRGYGKAGYLRTGNRYTAVGFVRGKLRYQKGKKIYYFPRVNAKSIKMKYTKQFNYSRAEAENYVNHRKLSSKTKYLVWVSLYTQHVYFFKGSKGKWKCIKDNEVSTGVVQSATATGTWTVKRKWRSRHGISYWTNFYAAVSLHSWANTSVLGSPHSGGCVRMKKSNARWAYNKIPKRTTVVTF